MPRNVVTVSPRLRWPLPGYRREQQRILAAVALRHRPTPHTRGEGVQFDFSKRAGAAVARADVVGWLEEINADWPRYVRVYPRLRPRTLDMTGHPVVAVAVALVLVPVLVVVVAALAAGAAAAQIIRHGTRRP